MEITTFEYLKSDPVLKRRFNLAKCEKYEEFVEILYQEIDDQIKQIQNDRIEFQECTEDSITACLKRQLNATGFLKASSKRISGNADIVICDKYERYEWIGEAKLVTDGAYAYIYKGFLQLVERYDCGDNGYGGVFIYYFCENVKEKIDKLKETLIEKTEYKFEIEDYNKNSLSFYTKHNHTTTGKDYQTRFIPVLLYYKPKD